MNFGFKLTLPSLNKSLFAKGFPLPHIDGIDIVNPQLRLEDDFLVIEGAPLIDPSIIKPLQLDAVITDKIISGVVLRAIKKSMTFDSSFLE
jgi:hypothetical protein